LSGAFVDMLKRVVGLSGAVAATDADAKTGAANARDAIPPTRVLDGYGAFEPPPPTARPILATFTGRATADNPPGFYGPPEGLVAVNTLAPADRLEPIDFSPLNARVEYYRTSEPQDLRGPIFLAALAMLLIDALVVFWLTGGLYRLLPRRGLAASMVVIAALVAGTSLFFSGSGFAQTDRSADQFASRASLETHLAYVVTGDAETDSVSKSGLHGLTLFLAQRTALEAGDPIGVDIAKDELAFFPLIYWPVVPGSAKPSPEALARIDAYMKQGGTVLFDTRDAVEAPPGPGGEARSPGMVALRAILSSLDIPELEPVPKDHVLTKTFFLLRDFPGRFTSGQLWVEALANPDREEEEQENKRPARGGDGVSSIIITSNDLAGAWATRPDGQPTLPLVPGEPRQREFAFRAGVNIVMYTLTGNYKADQVHVPALLERLGQ
jgi:hypothetical protein